MNTTAQCRPEATHGPSGDQNKATASFVVCTPPQLGIVFCKTRAGRVDRRDIQVKLGYGAFVRRVRKMSVVDTTAVCLYINRIAYDRCFFVSRFGLAVRR